MITSKTFANEKVVRYSKATNAVKSGFFFYYENSHCVFILNDSGMKPFTQLSGSVQKQGICNGQCLYATRILKKTIGYIIQKYSEKEMDRFPTIYFIFPCFTYVLPTVWQGTFRGLTVRSIISTLKLQQLNVSTIIQAQAEMKRGMRF